ncbi:unnamed protein product [Victoria cruziana]
MPGYRVPSDYSQEPSRHPSLKINAKEPFNVEPLRCNLIASYITPVDMFYKRIHGPIPLVDDIDRYRVIMNGLIENSREFSMAEIRSLPKCNVKATFYLGGARLSDVLELIGIPKLTEVTSLGGKHVELVSVDKCKEEKGGSYEASIPLGQATNPLADVLLAYEMNGEFLKCDHGYPLRVIVPGVIGARSVKWLDCINILAEESQGFFMQKDYKVFPPSVNWDNIVWSSRRPQMDFPVQSAICSLEDVVVVKQGKTTVRGYAASGGGRGIERVDLSIDDVSYVSDDIKSDKWAWVFFEAIVDLPPYVEIVVKAVDVAANVQPESVEEIWNLRGVLNTSWHRVRIRNASLSIASSHL